GEDGYESAIGAASVVPDATDARAAGPAVEGRCQPGESGVNGEPGSWAGGGVGGHALCVLAPNPRLSTVDGTNTWVLGAPGATRVVVVDPGPHDERHLHAVLDAVRARGAEVVLALVTHGHEDHVAGARRFAELAGCPVRAADAALCV